MSFPGQFSPQRSPALLSGTPDQVTQGFFNRGFGVAVATK